jgi:ABC-type polysaccharide/polyol phosphate export permease
MHWGSFALSSVLSLVFLVVGIKYFRHTERTFADVI